MGEFRVDVYAAGVWLDRNHSHQVSCSQRQICARHSLGHDHFWRISVFVAVHHADCVFCDARSSSRRLFSCIRVGSSISGEYLDIQCLQLALVRSVFGLRHLADEEAESRPDESTLCGSCGLQKSIETKGSLHQGWKKNVIRKKKNLFSFVS